MSSDIAIKVEGLSKCYEIYVKPHHRLLQMLFRGRKQFYREFWALKDVSFEIKRGETVGIIGRNGSGKSTLLQMICGTLNPSAGNITVNGRVAALLELGAGFNPEFTGRENVYMAASLYGLSREEVDQRFSDIEKFADIGAFIEQPVKTYSSGMYVRLAFAVIAHVDADILVIDEALAVGDAVFVQKCMRYIRKFQEHGTLLFVSHDASSVTNLCEKAIWLDSGQLRVFGRTEGVTKRYMQHCLQAVYGDEHQIEALDQEVSLDAQSLPNSVVKDELVAIDDTWSAQFFDNIALSDGFRTGTAEVVSVKLNNADGSAASVLAGGERLSLRVCVKANGLISSPIIGFFVKDRLGQALFGEHTFTYVQPPLLLNAGEQAEAVFLFTLPMLPNGDYAMTVSVADGDPWNHVQHHWLHDAVLIKVSSEKLRYGLVGIPFESVSMCKREHAHV